MSGRGGFEGKSEECLLVLGCCSVGVVIADAMAEGCLRWRVGDGLRGRGFRAIVAKLISECERMYVVSVVMLM